MGALVWRGGAYMMETVVAARGANTTFLTPFLSENLKWRRTGKIAILRIILKNFKTVSENFDNYCGEF